MLPECPCAHTYVCAHGPLPHRAVGLYQGLSQHACLPAPPGPPPRPVHGHSPLLRAQPAQHPQDTCGGRSDPSHLTNPPDQTVPRSRGRGFNWPLTGKVSLEWDTGFWQNFQSFLLPPSPSSHWGPAAPPLVSPGPPEAQLRSSYREAGMLKQREEPGVPWAEPVQRRWPEPPAGRCLGWSLRAGCRGWGEVRARGRMAGVSQRLSAKGSQGCPGDPTRGPPQERAEPGMDPKRHGHPRAEAPAEAAKAEGRSLGGQARASPPAAVPPWRPTWVAAPLESG